MLILARKPGESIVIDGQIAVKVLKVEGDTVKLGIEAPASVTVHRQEIHEEIQRNNQGAVVKAPTGLPRLATGNASDRIQQGRKPA